MKDLSPSLNSTLVQSNTQIHNILSPFSTQWAFEPLCIRNMALKWGIVSTGKISHDFVTAIGTLSQIDHKVVAVAARDLSRAKQFSALHEIPIAYGSYDELANDPNVEVVYVATSSPHHFPVASLMLEHGKHVLCEKPLCMNEKLTTKLVKLAKEKQRFLLEGMWSRFFPSYDYVRDRIRSGALGDIVSVTVNMGFAFEDVGRLAYVAEFYSLCVCFKYVQ